MDLLPGIQTCKMYVFGTGYSLYNREKEIDILQ